MLDAIKVSEVGVQRINIFVIFATNKKLLSHDNI